MYGYDGQVIDQPALRGQPDTLFINSLVTLTQPAADVTRDDNFSRVLASNVMISSVDTSLTGHLRTRAHKPLDFRTLAARWMISPAQAQKTIDVTTQQGANLPQSHHRS